MAGLREMLLQEQNRLEKILQNTSEQLKDAPPGKLRLSSSNKMCSVLSLCAGREKKTGSIFRERRRNWRTDWPRNLTMKR